MSREITGNLSELHATWDNWVEKVPVEERKALAEIVGEADLGNLAGVNNLAKAFILAMLEGTLSPAVAYGMRSWVEVIIFNIQSMSASAGMSAPDTRMNVLHALSALQDEMKSRPIQPRFLVSAPAPLSIAMEEPETVKIEAKNS